MKWLGILTQITDNDTAFDEIVYELFSSEEDMERSLSAAKKISQLLTINTTLLDLSFNELNNYMKSSKKHSNEVYRIISDENGITFEAVDTKVTEIIDKINHSRFYVSKLHDWMNSSYVFSESDIVAIPELKDFEFTSKRFVYSIPFAESTTWNKLGISKKKRRAYVVDLANSKIDEEIV